MAHYKLMLLLGQHFKLGVALQEKNRPAGHTGLAH